MTSNLINKVANDAPVVRMWLDHIILFLILFSCDIVKKCSVQSVFFILVYVII